ncbi:MAG TPA: M3 family oligoendopeptidase [Ktedonobacterales bacterium]|nr:M3 family oligoendopeptidase [Ktedonobacterales bacterium]
MSSAAALPRWDLSGVFPSLESPEFAAGFASAVAAIDGLAALFDEEHIAAREPAPLDDATVRAVERVITRYNAVLDEVRTLGAYIAAFVSTNSRDDVAQARQSELRLQSVKLAQLGTRFIAWVGSLDVDALLDRSHAAREHEWLLRKAKMQAAHLMSPAEEALATELNLTGGSAWGRLHSDLTSQLAVPVELPDGTRELTMSAVRNLAYDPDRDMRRRGYEAELAGWARAAAPLAAALNSIKGQGNVLARRRGWESPLDEAIFDANIDRQTLDAMMTAARESFPDFRRYLRAKARALGVERLAWYDLFAPVGGSGKGWTFDEARAFVIEQFGVFSPRMSDFAARAFRERWIDAEPRPGKVDGAFCMSLRGDESRVLSNFKPGYPGMSTLAHELGHGYHNMCLAPRTMLQKSTPMTLAETASIFCETIVRSAALERADARGQIEILEASLQNVCQVVVDITSRFLFESGVFERRRQRELSIDELNTLMVQTQRDVYGDGLDEAALHPYMWAVKSHYYSAGRSFYNFPYMFGLLFGLGLYARYQKDAEGFKTSYDDLLSSTGLADAATLAGRFDIDLRTPEFWRASLDIVRADIARFEELV